MSDGLANAPASVRQRLLNLSRSRGEDYQLVLMRYAVERLMYRLGQSPHANDFVLKGAMLFGLWTDLPRRSTLDLDLAGFGDDDADHVLSVFRSVCRMVADDGAGRTRHAAWHRSDGREFRNVPLDQMVMRSFRPSP